MNQDNENLNKLVQKLQTIAEDQFSNLDIQFAIHVDEDIPEIELPPIKIRNILMVYREIINNTIKHSQAHQVSIHIQFKTPTLFIAVQDNGIGFDLKANYSIGNGLKIIQDRMDEINATININSQLRKGTQTELFVPII